MKTQASLLAAAGIASAGMHGYDNCYFATSIGIDNLKTSPVGLHIDSVWEKGFAGITERNVFANGHLYQRDKYSMMIQTFTWSADTLATGSGDSYERYVLADDRITSQSNAQGLGASITYGDGVITRTDSASGRVTVITRDTFKGDSLVSEETSPTLAEMGFWLPNHSCKSTATTCDCLDDEDTLVWKITADSIEAWDKGTLEAIYYTSYSATSVRLRSSRIRPGIDGFWRVDGARTPMPRAWMPVYGPSPRR